MDKRTIRVADDVAAEIDRRAEADGISESAAARALLRRGIEADDLEAERDRLRRQLQTANSRYDEHTELVEYVERERELQQLERERRTASIWERGRWLLFGRD
jgi:predicted  nucleic acid-binding Zn-ribbon protein